MALPFSSFGLNMHDRPRSAILHWRFQNNQEFKFVLANSWHWEFIRNIAMESVEDEKLVAVMVRKLHAHVRRQIQELRSWTYWDEPLRQIAEELNLIESLLRLYSRTEPSQWSSLLADLSNTTSNIK
jgi:hypothetical protein